MCVSLCPLSGPSRGSTGKQPDVRESEVTEGGGLVACSSGEEGRGSKPLGEDLCPGTANMSGHNTTALLARLLHR